MALIETSYTNNYTKNSNSQQEREEQQKQETLNFIPVIHVKDVYKSFDYKNNNNNNSTSVTINYGHVRGQQQQLLSNSTGSLRTSSHEVLNGVDLKIKEGELVTIVGSSGCGKSTLLNMIAGLDRPDSGIVLVRGALATNNASSTKRIMVFQESALFPWLNVQENAEFGLRIVNIRKERRRQVADKHIEMAGLSKFSESFVYPLSGGE